MTKYKKLKEELKKKIIEIKSNIINDNNAHENIVKFELSLNLDCTPERKKFLDLLKKQKMIKYLKKYSDMHI